MHETGGPDVLKVEDFIPRKPGPGEVTVRLERGGRIVNGVGSDTDIIIASAKAYIEALNLIARGGIRQHPQVADV